ASTSTSTPPSLAPFSFEGRETFVTAARLVRRRGSVGRMARPRYPKHEGPLPPPLPHETRTVGQLVAETVRLYGERFWHVLALGSLCTVALVYFLTRTVLLLLLRGQGDATERVAGFLADLVLSPLLFLGAAQLYFDQRARVRSSKADGALPRGKPPASGPVRH